MINWMYFPQNKEIEPHLKNVVDVFKQNQNSIDSYAHAETNLKSDEVLTQVSDGLEKIGFLVEKSKKLDDKIRIPVLFGKNGEVNLAFEVDAFSEETGTVIEIEAGRGVCNYQFLKDFYEACMMQGVKYFCVAIKNKYRESNDFEKVCKFFQALYLSKKIEIPLKGILIIGY